MERRDLLSLGGIVAVAGAFGAAAEAQAQGPAQARATDKPGPGKGVLSALGKKIIRVYSDAKGESHIEEIEIATKAGRATRRAQDLPATAAVYAEYTDSVVEDWHKAPGKQFSISMSGEIEVEVTDGTKHAIHPGDMVFLEDTTGKGHITRLLSPVTNIFVRMPDNFDVVAWARGDAK